MGYGRRRGQSNIRKNAAQGKRAERQVRAKYKKKGYNVRSTGIGHDFKVTRRGSFGYRKTIFVEVKSGNARLSTTQRNAKRRLGSRYVVERVSAGKRHAYVS